MGARGIDNLVSMLQNGILSHRQVESQHVSFTPMYHENIVHNRKERLIPDQRRLWDYANLYFQPRNPMRYKVLREKSAAPD